MKNGAHFVEHVKLQLLSTWIVMCDGVIDRLFILLFIKIKIDRQWMNIKKILTHALTQRPKLVQPECFKPNVHFMTNRLFWLIFHLKCTRTDQIRSNFGPLEYSFQRIWLPTFFWSFAAKAITFPIQSGQKSFKPQSIYTQTYTDNQKHEFNFPEKYHQHSIFTILFEWMRGFFSHLFISNGNVEKKTVSGSFFWGPISIGIFVRLCATLCM